MSSANAELQRARLDLAAAVKDLTRSVEMAMEPAAGGMKMKQQNRWIAPTIFRQEILPIGIVAYSDGKSGWLSTPQGLMTDREARPARVGGELLAVVW